MKRSAHGHHFVDVPVKPDTRAATPPVGSVKIDVRSLELELRRSTDAEVRFSDGDRALYATGGSHTRRRCSRAAAGRASRASAATSRSCSISPST